MVSTEGTGSAVGGGRDVWVLMAWLMASWRGWTVTPSIEECSKREAESPLLQMMNWRVLSYHLSSVLENRNWLHLSFAVSGAALSRQTRKVAASISCMEDLVVAEDSMSVDLD